MSDFGMLIDGRRVDAAATFRAHYVGYRCDLAQHAAEVDTIATSLCRGVPLALSIAAATLDNAPYLGDIGALAAGLRAQWDASAADRADPIALCVKVSWQHLDAALRLALAKACVGFLTRFSAYACAEVFDQATLDGVRQLVASHALVMFAGGRCV